MTNSEISALWREATSGKHGTTTWEFVRWFAREVAKVECEECAKINDAKAERLAQEAEDAARESDAETVTANRAAALLLIVCAANIRARKDSA